MLVIVPIGVAAVKGRNLPIVRGLKVLLMRRVYSNQRGNARVFLFFFSVIGEDVQITHRHVFLMPIIIGDQGFIPFEAKDENGSVAVESECVLHGVMWCLERE